jgi:putative hemolysin
VWFLTASSNLVLRPFGDRTTFTEARHSPDELREMLEEASEAGTVDRQAGEIATRALDLPDLSVSDVMIPRTKVVMLARSMPQDELRRFFSAPTYTRLPVHGRSHEDVIGYVHIKDLLAHACGDGLISLDPILRPALYVPEAKGAVALLTEMRRERKPFAVVIDESGGLAGIVTMDDLLDELTGHIAEEHDAPESPQVHREPDGSIVAAGSAPVRDVNRAMALDLPEDGDWTTIAGLCIALAGRIPRQGERIDARPAGTLEVLEASDRSVVRVRIVPSRGRQEDDP